MTDSVGSPALARCVGDVDRFLRDAWNRRPALREHEEGTTFDDLISVDGFDRLVTGSALRLPTFRLVKDGKTLPSSSYTRSARTGAVTATGVADPRRVLAHFGRGATIVLQGMHRFWPPLTAFCRELEIAMGHATQVNAYITPAGAQGLAVHSDPHDVFVLQVFGEKHWDVWPTGADASSEQPLMSIVMRPGDALYMPKGTPHSARAQHVASGHLTVGVLDRTWKDVVTSVLRRIEQDERLDEPLPVGYHRDEEGFSAAVKERLEQVRRSVEAEDPAELARATVASFLSSRQPLLGGGLADALALQGLTRTSVVRRRRGSICEILVDGDRLRVFLGDRELAMPAHVEAAMRALLDRDELTADDLAPHLDAEGRVVLVRRLVAEGLLEVLGDR